LGVLTKAYLSMYTSTEILSSGNCDFSPRKEKDPEFRNLILFFHPGRIEEKKGKNN
jgi:hypothetical protein